MSNEIFRKVSLDRLSSPEELDQMITVTKPRGWIALVSLLSILIIGIIWGFVGSVPTQVSGIGMITASEGVANVIHPVSGRITDVTVRPGDYVSKGDIIARTEQSEVVEEISSIKRNIELATDFNIESFLADDLVIDQIELSSSLNDLYAIGMQIKQANASGNTMNVTYLRDQLEIAKSVTISELLSRLVKAEAALQANSFISSQVEGRILETNITKGDMIQAGAPVASIIRENQTVNNLEVVLYVAPEQGKQILAGMDAKISPTIVKKEEYGYLLGKVISVSEYPVSTQSIVQTLGSQELANMFSGGGAPIEVRINLIPDSATVSGFSWSTSNGPPISIDSGNICSGTIVIENRRPIEMVIPMLNR